MVGDELRDPSLDRRQVVIRRWLGAVELGQPHRDDRLAVAHSALGFARSLPGREEGGDAIEVTTLRMGSAKEARAGERTQRNARLIPPW